jgi:uncharacterized protein YxeA
MKKLVALLFVVALSILMSSSLFAQASGDNPVIQKEGSQARHHHRHHHRRHRKTGTTREEAR